MYGGKINNKAVFTFIVLMLKKPFLSLTHVCMDGLTLILYFECLNEAVRFKRLILRPFKCSDSDLFVIIIRFGFNLLT